MADYSSRDVDLIPSLTFASVKCYIKSHKKSSGSKTIDRGFKYFSENYIHELSVKMTVDKPTVTGKCYHSQKKNETPIRMTVQFASVENPDVLLASCNCPIGLTGACGHVVGLLYQIAKFKMLHVKALPEDIAKTSQPQTWHEPRGQKIHGKAVQDLTVGGHSAKHTDPQTKNINSTLFNPIRGEGVDWKESLTHLETALPGMLIIPAIRLEHVPSVTCKYGQVPKGSILSYQQKLEEHCLINVFDNTSFPDLPCQNFMTNSYSTVLDKDRNVALESLNLSLSKIVKFEEQTRLQSLSPVWYKVRKNRLTASNIGDIYKRRKDSKPLVDRLKSTRHVTTAAMRQGLASEPFAAAEYAKCLNNEINLYSCGVVVSYWSPWLAATPDRKVYNPNMIPQFGLLEIKCPQVSTVLESKYLYKDDTRQLRLKRNHSYYYQVLAQMAVTGLEWCDFFVWCESDFHRETIFFNEDIWKTVKDKVDIFFFDNFL